MFASFFFFFSFFSVTGMCNKQYPLKLVGILTVTVVCGDCVTVAESEEEVEDQPEERQPSPEPLPENSRSGSYCEQHPVA